MFVCMRALVSGCGCHCQQARLWEEKLGGEGAAAGGTWRNVVEAAALAVGFSEGGGASQHQELHHRGGWACLHVYVLLGSCCFCSLWTPVGHVMSRSTAGHVGLHMPVHVVWYVGECTLGEHTVSATYGPYYYTW